MKRIVTSATILGLAVAVGGCGLSRPEPLVPSQFVRARPAVGPDPAGQPVGQSGALVYGDLHSPLLPDEYTNTNPQLPVAVPPLVRQDIPAPGQGVGAETQPAGNAVATSVPTTAAVPGIATGYQVVGTVLATVDTKPIFADKVLASLDRELAAEARKFPPDLFHRAAQQDIEAKIQEMIRNQLEIERADKSLNQDSKNQANGYAQMWRRQQITAAGGSEAVARERALESGESFDEQVQDQYNIALVQIYYSQHIAPKIQINAADLRRYYMDHADTEFTKTAEAEIRLIRIDVARSGGPRQAADKADEVIRDLKAGASFGDEASKFNDDESLMKKGGYIGWIKKGGYKYDKVEDAVWALQPGQFTDHPIEVSDSGANAALYIAKLEAKKGGAVQPFDSPVVQNYIHDKLFSQQLGQLREKELADLVNQASIYRAPDGLEIAVGMAMQRYPAWASAK
jgi:parvulin-like peptidyl-prolyl isomerase